MRCSIPRPMHTQTRRRMQWDAWTTSSPVRPRRWIRPEQLHQHLSGVRFARLRRFWCVEGPSTSFPSFHDAAHARRASSILSQAMRCASPLSSTSSSSLFLSKKLAHPRPREFLLRWRWWSWHACVVPRRKMQRAWRGVEATPVTTRQGDMEAYSWNCGSMNCVGEIPSLYRRASVHNCGPNSQRPPRTLVLVIVSGSYRIAADGRKGPPLEG